MNELMDLKERMEHERPAQWHELPDIAPTGRPSPPPW